MKPLIKSFIYYLLLSIVGVLIITGCKNDEIIVSGSVEGEIFSYQPANPFIKIPLEGIKVYILDAGIADNAEENRDVQFAFLDSVYTDKNGYYSFNKLNPLIYLVVPDKSDRNYAFEPLADTIESVRFAVSEKGESYTIDFKAKEPISGNSDGKFSMFFFFVNYNEIFISADGMENTIILQRHWYNNIYKTGTDTYTYILSNTQVREPLIVEFDYGYNYIFWGLYNIFTVSIKKQGSIVATFERAIDLPISGCPVESRWEIDWKNYSITRK